MMEETRLKKKKGKVIIAIIVSMVIIAAGALRIIQIERNYQANQPILDACVDKGGTVIIEQKFFWSLTSATCEEN